MAMYDSKVYASTRNNQYFIIDPNLNIVQDSVPQTATFYSHHSATLYWQEWFTVCPY
jgi:hypothetical protein